MTIYCSHKTLMSESWYAVHYAYIRLRATHYFCPLRSLSLCDWLWDRTEYTLVSSLCFTACMMPLEKKGKGLNYWKEQCKWYWLTGSILDWKPKKDGKNKIKWIHWAVFPFNLLLWVVKGLHVIEEKVKVVYTWVLRSNTQKKSMHTKPSQLHLCVPLWKQT